MRKKQPKKEGTISILTNKDLKVGDRLIAIYSEGYGNPGHGYWVEVTKITEDYITVKRIEGEQMFGDTMDFTNDERMCNKALIYSNYQHMHLFIGTPEEAKKADDERVEACELYLELSNLLGEKGQNLKPSTLKKVIDIIKKEI